MMEKRNNPESSCRCFQQFSFCSSFPFGFVLLQIQCDKLTIHTLQLYSSYSSGLKPTLYLPLPPSSGSFSLFFLFRHTILAFLFFSLLSVEASDLESMPFHSTSITFCFEKITLCLLLLPKICFLMWVLSSPFFVPGTLWFFLSIS